jgi:U3 small nucleolar RNA-associated protein 19
MAPTITETSSSKKRKAALDARAPPKTKRRREQTTGNDSELDRRVQKLEDELSKTTNGKSQMPELISLFDSDNPDSEHNLKVAICLCRVFSRMMAAGQFPWQKSKEEHGWQMREYGSYQSVVQQCLKKGHGSTPTTMLKLHMRMLKEESLHNPDSIRIFESFAGLVPALVEAADGAEVRKTFAEECLQPYQDCCYHSLEAIT